MGKERKRVRIVILADCLAGLLAGAERQIFELAKGLDKRLFDVTVVSLECGGKTPLGLFEPVGCRLAAFPVKRIYGLSGLIQAVRFVRFLRKHKTDILMSFHFSSDIWGAVTGRAAGVPVIISNRRDTGYWRKTRHVLAYKMINRLVSCVIVNTQAAKLLFMQQEGLKEANIRVLANGIDIWPDGSSHSGGKRREIRLKNDDVVIMHVANIRPVKGHEYLVRAFSKVVTRHPEAKLVLIGEDTMEGRVNQLVEECGITKNVHFLGRRDDARTLLRLADICVLPSLSEGLSNAIMEYMEAGKPVIATRVGGNPEIVDDGKTGILVAKQDERALEQALNELIEHPKKRSAMGKEGKQVIGKQYSLQRMVDNYTALFREQAEARWKILHLISSTGFFGAESIVLTLGEHVQDDRFESLVAVLVDKRAGQTENALLTRARRVKIRTIAVHSGGRFDIGVFSRVKKCLRKERIDVLHTHNYKSDIIGAFAARRMRIPAVATAHGFTDVTRAVSFYEKLDRVVLRYFFDRVVTVTGKMLPDFPDDKRTVILNGIDMSRFLVDRKERDVLRNDYHVSEEDILVGTVGRLSREKNHKMLLEAVYPLMRAQSNIKVMIVGAGPKEEELRQFAQVRHMADRILFTGLVGDTAPVYAAMDIYIQSSRTEGVPLTVLEAMASGLPVIATRVGGIPEIITDNGTGLLVDAADKDGLTARLKTLVNEPETRRRLAESAQSFVREHYTFKKMIGAYRDVYQHVLN